MADFLLVFVTCPSLAEAETIVRRLLDDRLIACASLGSHVHSYYTWKGERQEATEYPLLLKTERAQFAALEAAIRGLHPYEVPEIVALPIVAGSESYLNWLAESLAPSQATPQPSS